MTDPRGGETIVEFAARLEAETGVSVDGVPFEAADFERLETSDGE